MSKDEKEKKPRGRPVKNAVKRIDASPEDIAKAISLVADKELSEKRRIKK